MEVSQIVRTVHSCGTLRECSMSARAPALGKHPVTVEHTPLPHRAHASSGTVADRTRKRARRRSEGAA
eukprot:11712166-Alexandrium_andersonii.AAC.1